MEELSKSAQNPQSTTNGLTAKNPIFKITQEFLDRVYPSDLFGKFFNREQVAWIMAVYTKDDE